MFDQIISQHNLFFAWDEFRRGKMTRPDVQAFFMRLEDNIFDLHEKLVTGTYRHGSYHSFYVCDPKRRHIHKATVEDRLLHHAVVGILSPIYEPIFIYDSWSCRIGKGTHRAVNRLQSLAREISRNNTVNMWALQLDIRKFFVHINHDILLAILSKKITDAQTMTLLLEIVGSFLPGLPLGNVTSQLFANVYMNELDQFVKHTLKVRGYLRYADDFVLLHADPEQLLSWQLEIQQFLSDRLRLSIHEEKTSLRTYRSGIDFLGYVCFPTHRILRTKTKRRILRKINEANKASYFGVLDYCRSYGVRREAEGVLSN